MASFFVGYRLCKLPRNAESLERLFEDGNRVLVRNAPGKAFQFLERGGYHSMQFPLPAAAKSLDGRHQSYRCLVEDERMFVLEALTDMGFTVIQAGSAREGFMMAERNRDIELALVDVGLPDRSGLQLAADLRAAFPKLGIAIASGYGQELTGTLQDEHVVFLSKPFRVDALKEAVHRLGSALS